METVMHAFSLDLKRVDSGLLKNVESIRKKSGKVRDVDVLTGLLASLPSSVDDQCRIQLLEHLVDRRGRLVRKLHCLIAKSGKGARRSLRRYSFRIDRDFGSSKNGSTDANRSRVNTAATALWLFATLAE
jgi:CHAD domain-containing protein